MKNLIFVLCFAALITFAGCNKENPDQKEFNFDFQTDAEGWTGDFADYPDSPGVEEFYEFAFPIRRYLHRWTLPGEPSCSPVTIIAMTYLCL
jgi:hypothetical protein